MATRYLGGAIGLSGGRLIFDELELVRSVALQSDLYMRRPADGRSRPPDARGTRRRSRRVARRLDGRLHDSDGGPPRAGDDAGRTRTAGDFAAVARQRDRRRLRGAALVARRPNDRRGAPHRGGPRRDRSGRRRARNRCAAGQPSGRTQRIAGVDAGRRARALRGRGRRRAVPDLPGRRRARGRCRGSRERDEARSRRTSPPDGARSSSSATPPTATTSFRCRSTTRAGPRRRRQRRRRRIAPAADEAAAGGAGSQTLLSPGHAAPTFWTPTIESDGDELVVGAATGSADALGRHAYGIEAGWSARARPDWQLAYAYDRWRPTLFASYSDDTDGWRDRRGSHPRGRGGCCCWRGGACAASQSVLGVGPRRRRPVRLRARATTAVDTAVRRTLRARRRRLQQRARSSGIRSAPRKAADGRQPRRPRTVAFAAPRLARSPGTGSRWPPTRGTTGGWSGATLCSPSAAPPQGPGEMTPPRNSSAPRAAGRQPPASASASTPSACSAASTRTPSSARAPRSSMSTTGCRCGGRPRRRHHSRLSPHGARRGVRRRRPGVVETASAGTTSGRPLGARALGRYGRRLRAAGHVHRRRRGAARRHDRSSRAASWPSDGSGRAF